MSNYESGRPDYPVVPAKYESTVCRCGGRSGFTNPVNWTKDDPRHTAYTLKFDWWVCSDCLQPAPVNALNARLIRECEMCESPYFIVVWPDRNDICPRCD